MNIPYPIAAGLRIAALSYLGILLLLTLGQRRFIYHPTRATEDELLNMAHELELQPWRSQAGELIGWQAPVPAGFLDVPRTLVFHGNAGCALDRDYFTTGFRALIPPWETFLFEYPGYGARAGWPSEKAIMTAAEAALAEIPDDGRALFLVGESLGTGVAAALAARHPNRITGLLLITPFTRLADAASRHYPIFPVRWLLRERYDSATALENYHGRVACILAEDDEVVPVDLGEKLYAGYDGAKRVWRQPGGHNTLDYTPDADWWSAVAKFLQNRD